MNRSKRNEVDAVASMLLRDAAARREAGDIDGALLSADGADALLVILDRESLRLGRGWGETSVRR